MRLRHALKSCVKSFFLGYSEAFMPIRRVLCGIAAARLPAFLLLLCAGTAASEEPATPPAPAALLARVENTGFVKVEANSFAKLTLKQHTLAYWLGQAAIAIDPIIYDQLSTYGLPEKRLVEQIVAHSAVLDAHARVAITQYAELFWANRGNHDLETAQKFVPAFTHEQLKTAALSAQRAGAFKTACADLPPLASPVALETELQGLRAALFDAGFDGRGQVTAVALDYPPDPPSQFLAFGAMYDRGPSSSPLVR
jgi:hypothetical protein